MRLQFFNFVVSFVEPPFMVLGGQNIVQHFLFEGTVVVLKLLDGVSEVLELSLDKRDFILECLFLFYFPFVLTSNEGLAVLLQFALNGRDCGGQVILLALRKLCQKVSNFPFFLVEFVFQTFSEAGQQLLRNVFLLFVQLGLESFPEFLTVTPIRLKLFPHLPHCRLSRLVSLHLPAHILRKIVQRKSRRIRQACRLNLGFSSLHQRRQLLLMRVQAPAQKVYSVVEISP